MRLRLWPVILTVGLAVGVLGTLVAAASPQFGAVPSADKLRFRVVGDEPIAGADARTIVTGWKAIVLKDMVSRQCYVTFISGNAMSTSGPGACQ